MNVAASGKRLVAGPGDDNAADIIIGGHGLHCRAQFEPQFLVHGVQDFGAVQGHNTDAIFDIGQDMFVVAHNN